MFGLFSCGRSDRVQTCGLNNSNVARSQMAVLLFLSIKPIIAVIRHNCPCNIIRRNSQITFRGIKTMRVYLVLGVIAALQTVAVIFFLQTYFFRAIIRGFSVTAGTGRICIVNTLWVFGMIAYPILLMKVYVSPSGFAVFKFPRKLYNFRGIDVFAERTSL